VTHVLATKRTFPDRIYHKSDVVVPKGSAVETDFTTNYKLQGDSLEGDRHKAKSAGKALDYFQCGGILAFTNTGKTLLDRQPASNAHNYDEGCIILKDGGKPDFTTTTAKDYPAKSGKKVLSARSAGRVLPGRDTDLTSKEALAGIHPDVRLREGKKVAKMLAPEGDVRYDTSTNNCCMAGDEALRKSCARTVQKPRDQDGFSMRVEQERKWRKQLLGGTGSKAASTVSTLPAGFQSTKFHERAQRAAKYGARMQPLFEDDVKVSTEARGQKDIVVPDGEGQVGAFETTTGVTHSDPYKRIKFAKGAKTTSEASVASAFSATGSQAGSQVPRSEASHASGFAAAMSMEPGYAYPGPPVSATAYPISSS
jgi:hypothetical protein